MDMSALSVSASAMVLLELTQKQEVHIRSLEARNKELEEQLASMATSAVKQEELVTKPEQELRSCKAQLQDKDNAIAKLKGEVEDLQMSSWLTTTPSCKTCRPL